MTVHKKAKLKVDLFDDRHLLHRRAGWLLDGANEMIYEVVDEITNEEFAIDLSIEVNEL